MANALKQRLLQDIAELQEKPYPNIELHIQDEDITTACLVLNVDRYGPLHMTVEFPADYPLFPPRIRMDSICDHPNIFGSYICASILNTTEGYTPAYTLKGIAIQMLSFFSSDKVEQVGGGYAVDLSNYGQAGYVYNEPHKCVKCRHGLSKSDASISTSMQSLNLHPATPPPMAGVEAEVIWPTPQQSSPTNRGHNSKKRKTKQNVQAGSSTSKDLTTPNPKPQSTPQPRKLRGIQEMQLPDEILLLICEKLETEDLMIFAQSWSRVGKALTTFDVIRTRELQCFCLKKDFKSTTLGIGVNVSQSGKFGAFSSEFDLLSYEGFHNHMIRRSVHGMPFQHFLTLPISNGHWRKVSGNINNRLSNLAVAARLGNVAPVQVIYNFMNEVVVKLNQSVAEGTVRSPVYPFEEQAKSTLTHASEKAIESYFHLFHLLLCLATEQPSIVRDANERLRAFAKGATSKTECANLGHLLVAVLISDVEMTDGILKAIIKETITRNVVWMLDAKGANMPELSYMEPSAVSNYRLTKTFEASTTSYRLLMFLNLFRKTAVGSPRKPLIRLRDEAFDRHGAPPRGSAKGLADSIKRIHKVSNFPDFLVNMGVGRPSAAWFNNFLKECMEASVKKGYSKMPLNQQRALWLRQQVEPNVEVAKGLVPERCDSSRLSFFPGVGRGGPQGGRGRGNGRR